MKDEIARYLENNNLLFSEWKERHKAQGYTSFIQDGIVEPEVWFGESHRILFILKEAYNGDGIPNVDSNLIEELKLPDGSKGRIWSAVAEWVYGLEQTTSNEIPVFDNWLGITEHTNDAYRKRKCDLLRKCAILNVKKSNGVNGSDESDLRVYIEEDADLIRKQIEIIQPTIIVFGSTFHLIKDMIETDLDKRYRILGDDSSLMPNDRGCYSLGNKTLIAYYHPANQYPATLNFYGLVGMYHNFLKTRSEIV